MRRLDAAIHGCVKCGHICTPPETINALPHVMETYEVMPAEKLQDETAKITTLESEHEGNTFTVETIYKTDPNDETKLLADKKLVRCARSYAVVEFTGMFLEDANEIILKCPNCGNELYRSKWRPGR